MDLSEIKVLFRTAEDPNLRLAKLLRQAHNKGVRQCFGSWTAPMNGKCALTAAYYMETGEASPEGEDVASWSETQFPRGTREWVVSLNDSLGLSFLEIANRLIAKVLHGPL
jgi:hypothetical protein